MSIYDLIKLNSPEEFIEGLEKGEREVGKVEREVGKVGREGEIEPEGEPEGELEPKSEIEPEGEVEPEGERKFYVYAYFCPETHEPFYIGKGTGKRAWDHLNEWLLKRKTRFYTKLRKMLRNGITPTIRVVFDNLTEQEAFQKESSLIAHYGRRDLGTGSLTNMSDGGEGNSGHRYCEDDTRHTLYHVSGKVVEMTRLEFRENVCGGNHQTTFGLFNGKAKVVNGYSLERDHIEGLIDPDKRFHFVHAFNGKELHLSENEAIEQFPEIFTSRKLFRKIVKGNGSSKKFCLKGKESLVKRTGTIFDFTNVITGERFSGTQTNFDKYIGRVGAGSNLVRGTTLHTRDGWIIGNEVDESIRLMLDDWTKYHCRNVITGDEAFLTKPELKERINYSTSALDLIRGISKTSNGWGLVKFLDAPKKKISRTVEEKHTFIHWLGDIRHLTASEFREEIVDSPKVHRLIRGEINSVSGWFKDEITENKLKTFKIDKKDPFYYRLLDKETNEEVVMTRKEIEDVLGIPPSRITAMIWSKESYKNRFVIIEERVGYKIPKVE